ncbi:TonB-dependent receptor [Sporocytophaga myxococcoides]|nr:TonB-dependent receptor [Sporocytophaga myxococcoides]
MKSYFLAFLNIYFFLSGACFGQGDNCKVTGRVLTVTGEPIPYATIVTDPLQLGSMSDPNGTFTIERVPFGTFSIQARAIGFMPYSITITVKDTAALNINFTLSPEPHSLDEVVVTGKSEARKIKESGFNVNVIQTKNFSNRTSDLNQVLGTTTGVRIREDGGLGSGFSFSLNGFTSNQVRFFLDEIPMENFGSSLTLNNIPINLADRIEIYKGVVPVWLGSDALGGAINIVTDKKSRNFLDVSYSYGSFNTHRTSVNFAITDSATGLTVRANLFQNYSDNNYWVDVDEVVNGYTITGNKIRVRRFHDTYDSKSAIFEVGLLDKKYVDQLLFGFIASGSDKEIQTGATMERVYGERRQLSSTLMPTFKYQKKNLIVKGLSLSTYASYNFGHDQTIDTATARTYSWNGTIGYKANRGENTLTMYRYSNNLMLATANLSYLISEHHSLVANYTFNRFDRKGHDEIDPTNMRYRHPQVVSKSILGLGYRFDWEEKLTFSVFAKQYLQNGASYYISDKFVADSWKIKELNRQHTGWGLASQWTISRGLKAYASYENSFRLPEGWEYFGDGVNLEGNPHIKTEKSKNFNLGLSYRLNTKLSHKIILEGGFLYRRAKDFIRTQVITITTEVINEAAIEVTGFDADILYEYKNFLRLSLNGTWQNTLSLVQYDGHGNQLESYLTKVPNIPNLFGNADISVQNRKIICSHDQLSLGYRFAFVEEYFLKWEIYGRRDTKLRIPRQTSHAAYISYSLKNGRYNISADCNNIFDAQLYDNFKLQKPGRAFYVKLRYFISKP